MFVLLTVIVMQMEMRYIVFYKLIEGSGGIGMTCIQYKTCSIKIDIRLPEKEAL